MTVRRALGLLVVVSTLLRLGLAASLGPSNDEAYYALFVVHPDWSYFDHPPMVAVIASLGALLTGGATSAFALRLGFVALFAGSTLVMARLAGRLYGPRAGLLAALALSATGYFGVIVGTFALPDGPLLLFWLLTLDRLVVALDSPGRVVPWLEVGLAWGGALLSKYHAVFLPAGAALYMALDPAARRWLRRPGPYLALALGLACFAPVLAWNAGHGWVSFAFQGSRALGDRWFRPETLAAATAGQAAYLFPWIWLPALLVAFRRIGPAFCGDGPARPDRFLLCQAALPLFVFTVVACRRSVLPHWSLVGFLSLLPMLGRSWDRRFEANPGGMRRRLALVAALPLVLACVAAAQSRSGFLQKGGHRTLGLIEAKNDPTVDLMGWDQVARELERRGLVGRPDTFLFTGCWYYSGQLAFATGPSTPVLCYHPHDSRSFAYWSRPGDWVGRDGILVALDDRSVEPGCYDRWFDRIEPIGEFPVVRAGVAVHKVRLFRCVYQTRPFPFDDPGPRTLRRQTAWSRSFGDDRVRRR